MNGEMWQFIIVAIVFAAVLVAVYGFVFLPGRTPNDLMAGGERQDDESGSDGPERGTGD